MGTTVRFRDLFAPELHGRLLWFGRLRWLAVSGLAGASLLGPWIGLPGVWPSLFLVASVVAAYNLVFRWLLTRQRFDTAFPHLNTIAIGLTVMDLAALMVTVHYTGGLQSPLLAFFAFHMAIGTVIIASPTMYVMAGGVSVGALVLLVLEGQGALPFHPLVDVDMNVTAAGLNWVTLVAALFGVVYLTDSVASRLKLRTTELFETTEALSGRTKELRRLLGEMENLERRKSHYMRISAHQLRSPIGTILTSLRVLSGGFVDPSSARGRKLLAGAVNVAGSLLKIVNDLLDLAKIREGRRRAPWSRRVNLNQLLADLFDSLAPDAERGRVELVPDFKGVAVLEWGVPTDLVHAFENLIYNGIKYSAPGGRVTVWLRTEGDTAVVRIVDRGIGIPEEFVEQVFMEFVRAPNAKHHAKEGTGLGLAIVKEVIEGHGGRVAVDSRLGEGTTFTIRLPLRPTPPGDAPSLHRSNGSGYHPDTPPATPAS